MGKVINRWAVMNHCKKQGRSLQYILSKAGISRNEFASCSYIKTHGKSLVGPLNKHADLAIASLATALRVGKSDISININKKIKTGSSLFVNKEAVFALCRKDDRSVRWLLDKVNMSYNDYNSMSYLKMMEDGLFSPVKAPGVEIVRMATFLKCNTDQILISL